MLETGLLILSGAFLLVAICALPFFWQMWRVAKNMLVAMEAINRSLPEILRNLAEGSADFRSVACTVSRETEALAPLFQKIRAVLELGSAVENILCTTMQKITIGNKFRLVRGVIKGVKVFFEVLYDNRSNR